MSKEEYLLCSVIDHRILVEEGVEVISDSGEKFKRDESEEMLMRIRCDNPLSAERNCTPLYVFSAITEEVVSEELEKELRKESPDKERVCELLDSAFIWGLVLDKDLVAKAFPAADFSESCFFGYAYDRILGSAEFRKELFEKLCSEERDVAQAYALYHIDKKLGSDALDFEKIVKMANGYETAIFRKDGLTEGHDEKILSYESEAREWEMLRMAFCYAVVGDMAKVRECLRRFKKSDGGH